jgi:hypothetical protein
MQKEFLKITTGISKWILQDFTFEICDVIVDFVYETDEVCNFCSYVYYWIENQEMDDYPYFEIVYENDKFNNLHNLNIQWNHIHPNKTIENKCYFIEEAIENCSCLEELKMKLILLGINID